MTMRDYEKAVLDLLNAIEITARAFRRVGINTGAVTIHVSAESFDHLVVLIRATVYFSQLVITDDEITIGSVKVIRS